MSTMIPTPEPITLDGKTFQLNELKDRDYVELDSWVRRTFLEIAKSACRDEPSKQLREDLLSVALKEALSLTWAYGPGSELVRKADGISRLFWQSLDPKVRKIADHSEYRKLFADESAVTEFFEVFGRLNAADDSDETSGQSDSDSDAAAAKNP